jgi:hypothetical protein
MVKACHQVDGPVRITYYELPVLLVNNHCSVKQTI